MSLFGNKSYPKKEESPDSPTRGGGGLLDADGNRLQRGPVTQAQPAGGLFGGGGGGTGGGSLFGGAGSGTGGGNLLGGGGGGSGTGGGGLFGGGGGSGSGSGTGGGGLFANLAQAQAEPQPEQPRTGGGLFGGGGGGTGGGSLFGGNRPQGGGGGLFGGGGNRPQGAAGIFGGGVHLQAQGQPQPQQPPTKPLNVYELQGNAPYNPNPTATNTRGQGTVNYDLKFGKSAENYDIYSITCANNADKNKSIEELRAEDYELIRSGELPEHLQLKLIENREKLEKSLGFALPVPTSTTATKSYTRVFKSQTRNSSMKSSFLSNKYSDVTFKVGDESIPAHRNILGTCSQHFDNLFSKHESNTVPLVIEIHDAKPEAFKAVLEFLYCGEVNLYEELAAELLIIAPRFDLDDLATGAEDFLTKVINADNYLRMLETSDRIGSKSLRKKVFTYIIRNMKVISKREDFEELPRPLLMEILENAITA